MNAELQTHAVRVEGYIEQKDGTRTPFVMTGEANDEQLAALSDMKIPEQLTLEGI